MLALELKIPPPIVTLTCAALMYAAQRLLPDWHWDWAHRGVLGIVVALLGIMLDLLGVVSFYRAKTTVNPLKPASTSTIVQTGIYRFTRNPMYLGMLLVLLGFALYLMHPVAFLLLPAFVAFLTRYQIIPEERHLAARFGAEYTRYVSRVRRWL